MADNKVEFIINIGGTAYKGVAALDTVMGKLNATSTKTTSLFDRIGASAIKMNNIFQFAKSTIGAVTSAFDGYTQANQMQAEAETRHERHDSAAVQLQRLPGKLREHSHDDGQGD